MSDYVYMNLVCRAQDRERFESLGFREEHSVEVLPDGVVFLVDPQANYAHGSKLQEMARGGCVFFGHYDAGAEFDGGYVASDGTAFHDVPALWHEARPSAAVNCDGSLDGQQRETIVAYYASLAQARSVLGSGIDGGTHDL